MSGGAFYNEIDDYAADWLGNLIAAGHIAPGVVDRRSIVDLDPDELRQYTQCHFFAGIGVWSHALRLAGVPDSRSLWTGSCPCQPFSAAGKGEGHQDERHLWPAWHRLIRKRKPAVVFGGQVASADGRAWLDVVCTDMEDDHYAIGAADLSAAGVGAPHIRQRLFFVAHAAAERSPAGPRLARLDDGAKQPERQGNAGLMAHASSARAGRDAGAAPGEEAGLRGARGADGIGGGHAPVAGGAVRLMGNAELHGCTADSFGRSPSAGEDEGRLQQRQGSTSGFWGACDWLPCRDGKARPTQPGIFPLAHGYPGSRVGILRAAGNAIVPQVAAEFIRAAAGVIA